MRGGYAMVNCDGLNPISTVESQTIAGLYAKLHTAVRSGKPVVLNNLYFGDYVGAPIYAMVIDHESNGITCSFGKYEMTVTSADAVTVVDVTVTTDKGGK